MDAGHEEPKEPKLSKGTGKAHKEKPAKAEPERKRKGPSKYEEPLNVDMDFGEFLQRIVRVKPGEKEEDR